MPAIRDGAPSGATRKQGTLIASVSADATGTFTGLAPETGEILYIQSMSVSADAATGFSFYEGDGSGTVIAAGNVIADGSWNHMIPGGGLAISAADTDLVLIPDTTANFKVTVTGYSLKDVASHVPGSIL